MQQENVSGNCLLPRINYSLDDIIGLEMLKPVSFTETGFLFIQDQSGFLLFRFVPAIAVRSLVGALSARITDSSFFKLFVLIKISPV